MKNRRKADRLNKTAKGVGGEIGILEIRKNISSLNKSDAYILVL